MGLRSIYQQKIQPVIKSGVCCSLSAPDLASGFPM